MGGKGWSDQTDTTLGGVQNSLRKRLAKFELAKSKTLGVIADQKTMTLIKEKNKQNKKLCSFEHEGLARPRSVGLPFKMINKFGRPKDKLKKFH